MANQDSSQYTLRYNEISQALEAAIGNYWIPITLTVSPTLPAGLNTQIQYNNNGTFGADANLTWDSVNQRLNVLGIQASVLLQDGLNATNLYSTGFDYTNGYNEVTIGVGNTGDPSAILEIDSHHYGFLPPTMTTVEKTAISNPANGLIVFDTDLGKLCVFSVTWQTITSA